MRVITWAERNSHRYLWQCVFIWNSEARERNFWPESFWTLK